jgi:hypothetical protein
MVLSILRIRFGEGLSLAMSHFAHEPSVFLSSPHALSPGEGGAAAETTATTQTLK